MRVFRLHGIARLHRFVGHTVSRAHEITDEFLVEHFDFSNPLAGGRADPAGDECAGGKAVMLGERRSIHVSGDQRVGVESLLEGNAANKGRDFAGNLIEAAEHDMLARGLYSGALQEFAQPRTRELRSTHCTLSPLNAGDLRAI